MSNENIENIKITEEPFATAENNVVTHQENINNDKSQKEVKWDAKSGKFVRGALGFIGNGINDMSKDIEDVYQSRLKNDPEYRRKILSFKDILKYDLSDPQRLNPGSMAYMYWSQDMRDKTMLEGLDLEDQKNAVREAEKEGFPVHQYWYDKLAITPKSKDIPAAEVFIEVYENLDDYKKKRSAPAANTVPKPALRNVLEVYDDVMRQGKLTDEYNDRDDTSFRALANRANDDKKLWQIVQGQFDPDNPKDSKTKVFTDRGLNPKTGEYFKDEEEAARKKAEEEAQLAKENEAAEDTAEKEEKKPEAVKERSSIRDLSKPLENMTSDEAEAWEEMNYVDMPFISEYVAPEEIKALKAAEAIIKTAGGSNPLNSWLYGNSIGPVSKEALEAGLKVTDNLYRSFDSKEKELRDSLPGLEERTREKQVFNETRKAYRDNKKKLERYNKEMDKINKQVEAINVKEKQGKATSADIERREALLTRQDKLQLDNIGAVEDFERSKSMYMDQRPEVVRIYEDLRYELNNLKKHRADFIKARPEQDNYYKRRLEYYNKTVSELEDRVFNAESEYNRYILSNPAMELEQANSGIKIYSFLKDKAVSANSWYERGLETAGQAGEEREKNVKEFMKKYPNIYSMIFSPTSGANIGVRLGGLASLLASAGSNILTNAYNGYRGVDFDESFKIPGDDFFSKLRDKSIERFNDRMAAGNEIGKQEEQSYEIINSYSSMRRLPDNVKSVLATSLATGVDTNEMKDLLSANGIKDEAAQTQVIADYSRARLNFTQSVEKQKNVEELNRSKISNENLVREQIRALMDQKTQLRKIKVELEREASSITADQLVKLLSSYGSIYSTTSSNRRDSSTSKSADAGGSVSAGGNAGVARGEVRVDGRLSSAEMGASGSNVTEYINFAYDSLDNLREQADKNTAGYKKLVNDILSAMEKDIKEIDSEIASLYSRIRSNKVNDGVIKAPGMRQWLMREDGSMIELHPSDSILATKLPLLPPESKTTIQKCREDEILEKLGWTRERINRDPDYHRRRIGYAAV